MIKTAVCRALPRTFTSRFLGLSLVLGLLAMGAFAVPALGSTASEEREGQQVLQSVDSGERKCADLSDADYERVGEYVMGRMAGSTKSHEQMNQFMSKMMGKSGEEQMHQFMGRRFTRCGEGKVPAGFGGMMGGPGMMGGAGMMVGGASGQSYGYGGMMGRYTSSDDDGDWGAAAIVMTVLMAALLAALAVLLFRRQSGGKGSSTALDILDDRYARGEIDAEEHDRRRKALGGG